MSNFELFLIGVLSFFTLLPVPRFIYRNTVSSSMVILMIGSIAGLIVLFVHHFVPK